MTTALIHELADDPRLIYRHTVDQYHQMIAGGTIEESAAFELLDGQVVRKIRAASGKDPMSIGPHHMAIVTRLGDFNPKLRKLGCYMRVQGPLTLPPYDEPEPDGAIVVGNEDDYLERHPVAQDVLCVIEVADASIRRDRGYKQRVYADSGLPIYLIINLPDRVAEVYTRPLKGKGRYGQVVTLSSKEAITFPTERGRGIVVPVRRLLP